MKTKFLTALISVVLLASCRGTLQDLVDPTDYLEVNNIYETVDMGCFSGFVNNISVHSLIEIYGKPDSIYDAYESTTIEGYDIYEYKVDDGCIDCYVPKQEDGMTSAVEYIYFEPKNNIDVSSFVKDKKLCSEISSSKNNVYYIADKNRNFIRFRLDEKDKSKILNIAIDDITLLDIYNNDIVDIVKEVKESLPSDFTDLGTLTNVEFSDNCLSFHIDVNETETIKLSDILNQNPDLAKAMTYHIMYNQGGYIGYADNSLLKRQSNISYKLKGSLSNQTKEINIPFNQLKSLIGTNVTNEKALLGKILLDNCLCPIKLNDWLTSEKKYIKDNNLIIPFKVTLDDKNLEQISSDFKNYAAGIFMQIDNPDSQYVLRAYKCNYDMYVVFYIDGTEDKLVAKFDQDDLWIMMENMK